MTMNYLAPLVLAALLVACATAPAQHAPAAAKPVALEQFYQGTWYEIGRRPMWLTDGCVAGGSTYTRTDATHLTVLDFCRQGSPTGKEKTIGGPATIIDPGTNARMRVNYRLFGFIPVTKEYQVLDHADDYSWFISSDPTFHDLWIYTRSASPSAELVTELTHRAAALGYDVTKLEFPAHA